MQWSKDNVHDVGMALLDIEKTYDRIEWWFVINVLERLRFSPSFFKLVRILFKYSTTIIDVNGKIYEPISLGRSIRQGCALAPPFLLITDVLSYILNVNELDPPIKGIYLPN